MISCLSVFAQIIEFIPRTDIRAMVREHASDRGCKGFTTFHHLSAMLFCQLGQAASLRDIEMGMTTAAGKLSHVGLTQAPCRSTLSYANAHRSSEVFESLFYRLLNRADQIAGAGFVKKKKSFRFKNPLLSMDGSTMSLSLSLYPWAKFRRAKGGVKLHAVLDHRDYLPVFAHITDAKTHEIRVARELSFPPDSVVVFDRGYTDYGWYGDLCAQGVFFVTRLKDNALYEVVKQSRAPHEDILSDEVIRLTGVPGARCPQPLRRVEVRVDGRDEPLVFLTNQMTFASATIAAIYKERWQIELFFKAIKQNLTIKSFVGTSENALLTQIWTALIAILALKLIQWRAKGHWALSTLCTMLRLNLLSYRDLWRWLAVMANPPDKPIPAPTLPLRSGILDS